MIGKVLFDRKISEGFEIMTGNIIFGWKVSKKGKIMIAT